jgi:hypothetical protein
LTIEKKGYRLVPATEQLMVPRNSCANAEPTLIRMNIAAKHLSHNALPSLPAAAHQGWSANLFTITSDMFPRSAVGSVTSIGGMAGSVGGILIATFAGFIL